MKRPNVSHYRQRKGESFKQMCDRFRRDLWHYMDAKRMLDLTKIQSKRQRRFVQALGHLTLGEIDL